MSSTRATPFAARQVTELAAIKVSCWFQKGLGSLQTHPESKALWLAQPSRRSHYFILSSAIINHRFSLPINSTGCSPQMNLGTHASGMSGSPRVQGAAFP